MVMSLKQGTQSMRTLLIFVSWTQCVFELEAL